MTALDRRVDPRNSVLIPTGPGRPLSARLRVDQAHPFFFDHPLDHVPGLLLLEAAVQIAQMRTPGPKFVSRIEARFLKFAQFTAPISVTAQDTIGSGLQTYSVAIGQNRDLRARILVELSDYSGPFAPDGPRREAPVPPCEKSLVNKARPENVLIGTPRIAPPGIETQILPPPPNCRLSDSARLLHPLYLLESFMQLQRYLNSIRRDTSRMRDILTGVSFTQLAPIADPMAPLVLRGTTEFVETSRGRLVRGASIETGGCTFAECTLHSALAVRARKSA